MNARLAVGLVIPDLWQQEAIRAEFEQRDANPRSNDRKIHVS